MKTEQNTVRCNNCMWEGVEDDLKTFTDLGDNLGHNVEYFKGCPDCQTDSYLMDLEISPEQKTT